MTKRVRLKYRKTSLMHINIEDIIISKESRKLNPRFIYDLDNLIESVIENGVLDPIEIYFNKDNLPVLTHGFRRVLSVLEANEREGINIKTIPAKVLKNISNQDILVRHFVNNDSQPLKPIEEAKGFQKFVEWGWEIKTIAKKISRSVGYVNGRLELLNINLDLQKAVNEKKVTVTMAKSIADHSSGDKELEKKLTIEAMSGKKGKKLVKAALNKSEDSFATQEQRCKIQDLLNEDRHLRKYQLLLKISKVLSINIKIK